MIDSSPMQSTISQPLLNIDWSNFDAFKSFLCQSILPNYLPQCRWFRSKTRKIKQTAVNLLPLLESGEIHMIYPLNIKVIYADDTTEAYFLPITILTDLAAIQHLQNHFPRAILAQIDYEGQEAILIDAIYDKAFQIALFQLIKSAAQLTNDYGHLQFEAGAILETTPPADVIRSKVLNVEQSNTSIIYNDAFFLKLFRKLESGINPDLEILRFFSKHTNFKNAPQYGGSIQLKKPDGENPTVVALLQNKIENQGDAWSSMMNLLTDYYDNVQEYGLTKSIKRIERERLYYMDIPQPMRSLIGRKTCDRVVQLAQRTAEMHIALASNEMLPDFQPVALTIKQQEQIVTNQAKLVKDMMHNLSARIAFLPQDVAAEVEQVFELEETILQALHPFATDLIAATEIRVHGDYHLGQVLDDGQDFYIIDFEGEPMRSIAERRQKISPFKDVAGMIRSFHYAAYGRLYLHEKDYGKDLPLLENWASHWFHYISPLFLTAYLDRCKGQSFIPKSEIALRRLLRTFIVEKAIYEVSYEMNVRPDWLKIPIRGVLHEMG